MCCANLAGWHIHSDGIGSALGKAWLGKNPSYVSAQNMVGVGHPRSLLNLLCGSLHCIIAFPSQEKEKKKETALGTSWLLCAIKKLF